MVLCQSLASRTSLYCVLNVMWLHSYVICL